jgi:hypothetical protein
MIKTKRTVAACMSKKRDELQFVKFQNIRTE